jgi:hypothetical protein
MRRSSQQHIRAVLTQSLAYLRDRYNIKRIGVFGSHVRGKQKRGSDIDIVVELEKPIGLEFVDLAEDLEAILHAKVDLVSRKAIKSRLWRDIRKDVVYV